MLKTRIRLDKESQFHVAGDQDALRKKNNPLTLRALEGLVSLSVVVKCKDVSKVSATLIEWLALDAICEGHVLNVTVRVTPCSC